MEKLRQRYVRRCFLRHWSARRQWPVWVFERWKTCGDAKDAGFSSSTIRQCLKRDLPREKTILLPRCNGVEPVDSDPLATLLIVLTGRDRAFHALALIWPKEGHAMHARLPSKPSQPLQENAEFRGVRELCARFDGTCLRGCLPAMQDLSGQLENLLWHSHGTRHRVDSLERRLPQRAKQYLVPLAPSP